MGSRVLQRGSIASIVGGGSGCTLAAAQCCLGSLTLCHSCSRGDGEGALALRIESGAADVAAASWPGALLVAAGRDPYALVDAAVAAAARLSGAWGFVATVVHGRCV